MKKVLTLYFTAMLFSSVMLVSCKDEIGPPPPNADFVVTNNLCTAPCTLYFKNTSQNSNATFSWDFGNGKTGFTEDTAIRYDYEGVYEVFLTAFNDEGAEDQVRKLVEIAPAQIASVFSIEVLNLEFTKPSGLNWDVDGYPDVFVQIRKNNDIIWDGLSQIESDVDEVSVPVNYVMSSVWDEYETKYYVDLYDFDSTNHHELMKTFECGPEYFNQGPALYPDSLYLKDGGFEIQINTTWQQWGEEWKVMCKSNISYPAQHHAPENPIKLIFNCPPLKDSSIFV